MDALKRLLANEITDEEAVDQIAATYREFVDLWQTERGGA